MADNNQDNDEYKFAELDSVDNESIGGSDPGVKKSYFSESRGKNNIARNALIVVGIVILIVILYKIIGSFFFSGKTQSVTPIKSPSPVAEMTPPPAIIEPIPQMPTPPPEAENQQELQKQVATIELNQQGLRTEINSLREQIAATNSTLNNMNTKIVSLNQVIENFSVQFAKQSEVINVLITRSRPKKVKHIVINVKERVDYFLQAVIPGRAWLIGTNGSTLTVREGTKVAGYGVIKLIDSIQGKVLTSSGRVIRFSQADS
jgi:intracellular multiplication protein IcmG